jgi:Tfp pilus assembly protein PilP
VFQLELLFWFLIIIILLLIVSSGIKKAEPKVRSYVKESREEPSDVDLRLTYKRFKELYPYSQITYQEYKKLQMERAFKRAVSSEKNKRMVR